MGCIQFCSIGVNHLPVLFWYIGKSMVYMVLKCFFKVHMMYYFSKTLISQYRFNV